MAVLQPLKTQMELQEDLGDLEFQADLVTSGSHDPVAQLGFDPSKAKLVEMTGARFTPETDLVTAGPGSTRADIWNHEFRHRGFRILLDRFSSEEVGERFGPEAADLWTNIFPHGIGQEAGTEVFDNPDAPAGEFGTMERTIQELDRLTPEQIALTDRMLTELAFEALEERGK